MDPIGDEDKPDIIYFGRVLFETFPITLDFDNKAIDIYLENPEDKNGDVYNRTWFKLLRVVVAVQVAFVIYLISRKIVAKISAHYRKKQKYQRL